MSILDTVQLGRGELRVDPRTIQYRALAPTAWRPPTSFNIDAERGNPFPARMYGNDAEGNCVKAAQANHITRFEWDEQGVLINISDQEVHDQYRKETGGPDVGLDPIASHNRWRRDGWLAGGMLHKIHSWAQVAAQDKQQMQEAAIIGRGLQVCARLPLSAADQIDAGQPWDLVAGPRGEANSWGGHEVYMRGYDATYIQVWTWKKVQLATWRWVAAYCDLVILPIDDVDRASSFETFNADALNDALAHL